MSAIRLSYPHELDVASRKRALGQLSDHLTQILGADVSVTEWTLRFSGKGFAGTVSMAPHHVEGEITLGLMMRPLRGVIEREIEAGLRRYLQNV
jgi:hypothetical protein